MGPSPSEYGRLMGLSIGIDGKAGRPLTSHEVTPVVEMSFAVLSSTPEFRYPFWAEFASLCLPSLLRTYFNNRFNESHYQYESFIGRCVMELLCLNDIAPVGRFIRARPSEVVLFHHVLVERISQLSQSTMEPALRRATAISLTGIFSQLRYLLPLYLPPEQILPELSLLHRARFAELARQLAPHRGCSTPMSSQDLAQFLVKFDDMMDLLNMMRNPDFTFASWMRVMREEHGNEAWWRCELKASDPNVVCLQYPEGTEMPACGKCYSVRYCCRDHQKVHRKSHRSKCFSPTWV